MAKQTGKLYNPQIPPQREIEAMFANEIKARKGIRKTTRGPGEKYLSTCVCNLYVLTSDWSEVDEFESNHILCE